MANDIQITVGVAGGQDVLKLANAITTLGNNSEKLAKQLEGGRLENSAFVKGLSQQISALTKLGVSTSDATKFIMGNAKATRESIEAAKESKAANEAWLTTQKKMETAWALAIQKEKELAGIEKDLIASRAKLDAAAKQEAATMDQLRSKYQAGYASLKLYIAEQEQLNLAEEMGVLVGEELRAKQEELSQAFNKGTGIFATYEDKARSSASRMGVVWQQAGYQLGDFFVQVQSGTSVFTAFSQQATQMVGMMYLIPAAGMAAEISLRSVGIAASITMAQLTLGLSIAIPIITALGALYMKTYSSNNKANESAKASVEIFQNLTQATRSLNTERMKLLDPKFDENLEGTATALLELKVAYEEASASAEQLNFVSYIPLSPLTASLKLVKLYKDYMRDAAEGTLDEADASEKAYLIAKNQLLIAKTQATLDEKTGKERRANLDKNIEQIAAENAARTQMEENIAKYANSRTIDAQNQVIAAKELADELGQAYLDGLNLGKLGMKAGIDEAAAAAGLLADRMGISLNAALGIVNLASLASKGGQAYVNSPSYDPSNTRSGATGNQDTSSYTPSMAAQAARKLREWQAANPIPEEDKSSGAVAGRIDTQEEYLAKLAREYDMKKKSLGLTDDQIKRTQFLFTLDEKIATMKTKRTELEIETERKRAIAAYDAYVAAERQDALMGVVNSNINDAFMAMVDGSATVADAFRNMMFNILKSVYEQTVTQPAANAITGLLRGFLGGSGGGPQTGSLGLPNFRFADGGVVGSPTTFSMSGGKTGLMGEAGPEAIMPLKRGSNGQLGVQVQGGSGGMTVNNNITVTGSDAAAVRMEVAKMIPQITNATKAAIIDAKKRGGQMGAAFA